ncbi:AT-hook motif nuclear-localized protein 1-like [Bidens hawaiensis]|uniref:AT-hook motif nuclear-localized protein 1-like n=1 Tax=Bidens hawaiensis TaxID=980011 RepID=UPI00404AE732
MTHGGVTVVGSDAPSEYHIAPRTEAIPQSITNQLATSSPPYPAAGVTALPEKKKRGRPRKYDSDQSGVRKALSPKPISSAAPTPVIDFSTGKSGKVRPLSSAGKPQPPPPKEIEPLGNWVSSSVGANFMSHIINVETGEDVTMKVISFSQQGPRAICILSANGVISSVTLRQPDSSGGTLTYEGRFEILSLAGSFIPSESGGMRNRSGGMSVSLSSADGRVVGGSVAGLLVAASPVQIIVGSFLTGVQQEQKTAKKQKPDNITVAFATSTAVPVPVTFSIVPAPGSETSEVNSAKENKSTDINVNVE